MKKLGVLVMLVAGVAFADRALMVLEASLVVTGGDVTITADGGCEGIARIGPIADQQPAKMRRWSKEDCAVIKSALTKSAKADQRL